MAGSELRQIRDAGARVLRCADTFAFSVCEDCDGYHFLGASWRCGDRMCATCAHERYRHLIGTHGPRIEAAAEGRLLLFLTITVRNVPELSRETYQGLKIAFKRLRRHVSFQDVLGGVFVLETTYNDEARTWHPHLHAILVADKYVNQDELRREWLALTGESYIVNVRKADAGSVRELFKYQVKHADFQTAEQVTAYWRATRGVRMVQGWGCLYGITDAAPAGELEDPQSELQSRCVGCGGARFRIVHLPWDQNPPGPVYEFGRPVARAP